MLLKSLSDRNWEDAVTCIRDDGDEPWTEKRFEQVMAPYFDAHAFIDVSPSARGTRNTEVQQQGEQCWSVLQRIIDPEGDEDWFIEGWIDLDLIRDQSEPLVSLRRIGS